MMEMAIPQPPAAAKDAGMDGIKTSGGKNIDDDKIKAIEQPPSPRSGTSEQPQQRHEQPQQQPQQQQQQQQQQTTTTTMTTRESDSTSDSDRETRRVACVDITKDAWKTRSSRSAAAASPSDLTSWTRWVRTALVADLSFALGRYRGGGLVGPPMSLQQMYCDKVEIVPTASPSEGFERSCSSGVELKLDSSLQLISDRMKQILRRIEGRCRMSAVRFLGWALGKLWRVLFSRVEVGRETVDRARRDLEAAARAGKAVMLLPTHRSHVDYLLMSYISFGFDLPVPHIASGDNLNIPVLGPLFSYSGAFFLRRSFRGDNLYKKVLYGYLLRKLREGAPVEVFVEGGRSRTGMINDPKLGMIVMAVRFVRDGSVPDIMLLPSAIDYERVVETEGHVDQQLGSKKQSESLLGALREGLSLLSSDSAFGGVWVNFADGISVRDVIASVEAPYRRAQRRPDCSSSSSSSSGGGGGGGASGEDQSPEQQQEEGEPPLPYIPEETYVSAVASAVVRAQRSASSVTPAGVLAAALLGCERPSEAQPGRPELRDLFLHLAALADLAGARCAVDADALDAAAADRLVLDAWHVLRPLLDVKGSYRQRKSAKAEDKAANEPIDRQARVRLRLRYSCGQLLPALGAHAVLATALLASTEHLEQAAVKVDSVVRTALSVADVVRPALPGSRLTGKQLRRAMAQLEARGAVERLPDDRVRVRGEQLPLLRALRVLVAPSINAVCACLSATASLAHAGSIDRAELVEQTRRVIYSQCRGEATDWTRQFDQMEPPHSREGGVVGLPEALSVVEVKAAIKALTAMGVFGSGTSMMPPPLGHQSTMSLSSLGSSRSMRSSASSEGGEGVSERASSSADSQTGGPGAAAPPADRLELSPAYTKSDGMPLLEKLSSLQRFMLRDAPPCTDLVAAAPSKRAAPRLTWTTIGAAVLLSGALAPLLRAWRRRAAVL